MGKKFSIVLQKPKCLKCGRRLQIDRSETNYNNGRITARCFNRSLHDGLVLKFVIESELRPTKHQVEDVELKVTQTSERF